MKHAYLIMAHTNFNQLSKLLMELDDPRNDIYIHLDKKCQLSVPMVSEIPLRFSSMFFCKQVEIKWGNSSQVKAEMNLIECAIKKRYDYYHLISGFDIPLKNQNFIHDYFSKSNKIYLGFSQKWNVRERVYCHNIFVNYLRYHIRSIRRLLQLSRKAFNKIQVLLNFRQHVEKLTYKSGCNWGSFPHDFCVALLSQKDSILKNYKYSYCPDEIYKQTFAWNTQFRERLFDINDEFHGCLREIDWNRGRPYIWKKNDFLELKNSTKLFARKFDENIDNEIINMIYDYVRHQK